jgi:hypothetical protein
MRPLIPPAPPAPPASVASAPVSIAPTASEISAADPPPLQVLNTAPKSDRKMNTLPWPYPGPGEAPEAPSEASEAQSELIANPSSTPIPSSPPPLTALPREERKMIPINEIPHLKPIIKSPIVYHFLGYNVEDELETILFTLNEDEISKKLKELESTTLTVALQKICTEYYEGLPEQHQLTVRRKAGNAKLQISKDHTSEKTLGLLFVVRVIDNGGPEGRAANSSSATYVSYSFKVFRAKLNERTNPIQATMA